MQPLHVHTGNGIENSEKFLIETEQDQPVQQSSNDYDYYNVRSSFPKTMKHCPHCSGCLFNASQMTYQRTGGYVSPHYRSRSLDRNFNRNRQTYQTIDDDFYATPDYQYTRYVRRGDPYRTQYRVTYDDEYDQSCDQKFESYNQNYEGYDYDQPYDDQYEQQYEQSYDRESYYDQRERDYDERAVYWASPVRHKPSRVYYNTCPPPRRRRSLSTGSRHSYNTYDSYDGNSYGSGNSYRNSYSGNSYVSGDSYGIYEQEEDYHNPETYRTYPFDYSQSYATEHRGLQSQSRRRKSRHRSRNSSPRSTPPRSKSPYHE